MGVPETYGVIHLTCGHDGDIYGVTQNQVFKIDVVAERIVCLDTPPIPDLYQIVEGAPGVFYMGARGHLRISFERSATLPLGRAVMIEPIDEFCEYVRQPALSAKP